MDRLSIVHSVQSVQWPAPLYWLWWLCHPDSSWPQHRIRYTGSQHFNLPSPVRDWCCALTWFTSYLSNRSFSVNTGNYSSAPASPSILGRSYALYLKCFPLVKSCKSRFHSCNAGDTQLYLPLKPHDQCNLGCFEDIKCWIAAEWKQVWSCPLCPPPDSIKWTSKQLGLPVHPC